MHRLSAPCWARSLVSILITLVPQFCASVRGMTSNACPTALKGPASGPCTHRVSRPVVHADAEDLASFCRLCAWPQGKLQPSKSKPAWRPALHCFCCCRCRTKSPGHLEVTALKPHHSFQLVSCSTWQATGQQKTCL